MVIESGFRPAQLPPANEVWGKVIFSQACVKNSVHRGDAWSRGVPGPGDVCLVPGGGGGGRLLVRAVRILLECILVSIVNLVAIDIK